MATMVAYTSRMAIDTIDPVAIGRYWSDRCEDLFRACTADRHRLPADQSIDVYFRDFMRHDMDTVAAIYSLAGQPFTDEAQAAMRRFVNEHPRGRHGTVRYQPEVLGIDWAERSGALDFYVDHFGVGREEPPA
jgi:hypothetical protein